MTPLEAMAKAMRGRDPHCVHLDLDGYFQELARAALLALAEAELPEAVPTAGAIAIDGMEEKAEAAFRAMLRAIAEAKC